MAVTLRDIAKALGLSHATVSFVLNDRRDVAIPETTRQRVYEMARTMGYRPNRAARALVSGRTQLIAIWQPTGIYNYYGVVFDRIYTLLHNLGYETMFCRSDSAHDESSALEWPVDGVIGVDTWAFPTEGRNSPIMPYVSFGPHCDRRTDHIQIDLYSGASEAMKHLVAQGCKNIVHLTTESHRDNPRGKFAAYQEGMRDASLKERLVTTPSPSRPDVQNALANELKSGGIDAVFASDDLLAMSAYGALSNLGLQVPKDVLLVGFNDAPVLQYFPVPIASVSLPIENACVMAVEQLDAKIKDPKVPRLVKTMPTSFELRASAMR